MTYLTQFSGSGQNTPVGAFSSSFSIAANNVIDTGSSVFAKSGTTTLGASAATISKVQNGSMPGFAVPANSSTLGYSNATNYLTGNSFAYGNGIWLRSSQESLMKSTDGVNWKPVQYITSTSLYTYICSRIIYFASAFYMTVVDISDSASILSSTDGETWTIVKTISCNYSSVYSPLYATFTLCVANSILFAIMSTTNAVPAQIYSTTDGTTWRGSAGSILNSGSGVATEIAYGAGVYVIMSSGSTSGSTSTDGINWTSLSQPGSTTYFSVKFLNSLFVAIGTSGAIATSTNGTTWTTRTSNVSSPLHDIDYGAGVFVAVGEGGVLTSSPDGTTWTARTSGVSGTICRIIFANSLFVALQTYPTASIITSSNGTTWSVQTIPYTGALGTTNPYTIANNMLMYDGAASPKWWYMTSAGRSICNSSNATSWTRVLDTDAVSNANGFAGLFSLNGKIFTLPVGGGIQTCDPTTQLWTRTLDSTTVFYGMDYLGGVYVAVGAAGATYSSSNGTTWTSQSNGATTFIGITSGNGLFYAMNTSGQCRTSPDGATWTLRGTAAVSQNTIAFANGILATLSTSSTQAYRSADGGTTWAVVTIDSSGNTYVRLKVIGGAFFFFSSNSTPTWLATFDLLGSQTPATGTGSTGVLDAVYTNGWYIVYGGDGLSYSLYGSTGLAKTSQSWNTGQSVATSSGSTQNTFPGQVFSLGSQFPGLLGVGPSGELMGLGYSNSTYNAVFSAPDGGLLAATVVASSGAYFTGNPTGKFIIGSNYTYHTNGSFNYVVYSQRNALTAASIPLMGTEAGSFGGSAGGILSVHRRIA